MPQQLLANLEAVFALVLGSCMSVLGSTFGGLIADTPVIPDWSKPLLGPFGALVGMVFVVWWLTKRLNKVETDARKRQDENQDRLLELMKSQIEVSISCKGVIEKNTEVLNKQSEVLEELIYEVKNNS